LAKFGGPARPKSPEYGTFFASLRFATKGAMESPCVKVCTYDPGTGLCQGCGRTLQEIGDWFSMRDDERRAVMDQLPKRLRTVRAGLTH
jgi:predicted Fe-S protein YdhL (DUF1289 family)